MRIVIDKVPHVQQRYNTVGDYQLRTNHEENVMVISVSALGNWRYEALVAVHELLEAILCINAGIGFEDIDAFDFAYQGDGEPGDDPESPYYHQHQFASRIEWLLAHAMDVDWLKYEEAIRKVSPSLG